MQHRRMHKQCIHKSLFQYEYKSDGHNKFPNLYKYAANLFFSVKPFRCTCHQGRKFRDFSFNCWARKIKRNIQNTRQRRLKNLWRQWRGYTFTHLLINKHARLPILDFWHPQHLSNYLSVYVSVYFCMFLPYTLEVLFFANISVHRRIEE